MQEVFFPAGRHELSGRVFDCAGGGAARRGILFVHGQGSSQESYKHRAETASATLEAICLTFNLSGHGEADANSEKYSVREHLNDVIAAFDYLASNTFLDQQRIGVCGASYGGYLAALLTLRRNIRRLVLRAPSLAVDHNLSIGPGAQYEFDSLKALAGYEGEILIIQSERDEVIPEAHISAYLRANSRARKEVIPDAMHALTNPAWDRLFIQYIVDWFRGM
jgi:uncharacterized protein